MSPKALNWIWARPVTRLRPDGKGAEEGSAIRVISPFSSAQVIAFRFVLAPEKSHLRRSGIAKKVQHRVKVVAAHFSVETQKDKKGLFLRCYVKGEHARDLGVMFQSLRYNRSRLKTRLRPGDCFDESPLSARWPISDRPKIWGG